MSRVRKYSIVLVSFLIIVYLLARFIAPGLIDQSFNTTVHTPPYQVSKSAQQLYQSLDFVADLHSDALLWKRDLLQAHDYGHQDVPRMIEANLALQAFTIVNKVPDGLNFNKNSGDSDKLTLPFILQGRAIKSWFDLTERVLEQANHLVSMSADSSGQLSLIVDKSSFSDYLDRRKSNAKITAGFLGIEGAQALKGDLANIDTVYDSGVRMIGLTHFFDNELGGSAHGVSHQGLTQFGREAIQRMQQKGIFVDLSHASPKMIDETLTISTQPLIVSHTGVKGTCNNVRNLSDEHLIAIAKTGGLIGIAMFKQAVCGNQVKDIAKAIVYTANLVGAQHVALGSDFDGAVNAIIEVRGLPLIVEALLQLNMSEADIRLVMGDNIKRFLLTNLPD